MESAHHSAQLTQMKIQLGGPLVTFLDKEPSDPSSSELPNQAKAFVAKVRVTFAPFYRGERHDHAPNSWRES
jgi:hypothetical protein